MALETRDPSPGLPRTADEAELAERPAKRVLVEASEEDRAVEDVQTPLLGWRPYLAEISRADVVRYSE